MGSVSRYIPGQGDLVIVTFDPKAGKEIGKRRPALVISTKEQNKSGRATVLPVSTSIYGGTEEVKVNNLDQACVVVSNMPQTFDWKARKVEFAVKAEPEVLEESLLKLAISLGIPEILEKYLAE